MSSLHEALELQGLLEQVGDRVRDNPSGRSYLSPDRQAYVLAVGGEAAQAMYALMTAVGRYLMTTEFGGGDEQSAKQELLRAFDLWLSKQNLKGSQNERA
jgi:hypothetical protein